MTSKKYGLILFSIFVLSIGGILLNVYLDTLSQKMFVIGVTHSHDQMLTQTKTLEGIVEQKIQIKTYNDEVELMKAVYSGEIDAFVINAFNYIDSYSELEGAKAILGIPADYYLISQKAKIVASGDASQAGASEIGASSTDTSNSKVAPKDDVSFAVGTYDELLSEYLISGIDFKTTRDFYSPLDAIKALRDGIIQYACVPKSYYDADEHDILKKISTMGYTQDVLVLTQAWLEKETMDDLRLIPAFKKAIVVETTLPDESQIMNIMTLLFNAEINETRYYYDDLVFNGLK